MLALGMTGITVAQERAPQSQGPYRARQAIHSPRSMDQELEIRLFKLGLPRTLFPRQSADWIVLNLHSREQLHSVEGREELGLPSMPQTLLLVPAALSFARD